MKYKTIASLLLLAFLGNVNGQVFYPHNWEYIAIDSTKKMWGDFDEPGWLRYFGVDYGDVNEDGYIDIISGRYVYHNPGGDMTGEWKRTVLEENVDAILYVDVDGDEYADFIAQALPDVYWYEASNKQGSVYKRTKIASVAATDHVNSQGFETTQLVEGGKKEILIAGEDGIVAISIPEEDPEKGNWPRQIIAENVSSEGIGTGDIDGDGDIDIACGRTPEGDHTPSLLVWFENPGNIEQEWTGYQVAMANHAIDRVEIADLTGDDEPEIVITEERYPGQEPDANIFWYQSAEDKTSDWDREWIATQYSSNNLDVGDIDKDGDLDILTNEHLGPDLELQLWENDGKGNFTRHVIDKGKENHLGTQFVDLDGDGDLDILGNSWHQYNFMHIWRNDAGKTEAGL